MFAVNAVLIYLKISSSYHKIYLKLIMNKYWGLAHSPLPYTRRLYVAG
jgi:hypothetical protein